jgi:hypothetical protein
MMFRFLLVACVLGLSSLASAYTFIANPPVKWPDSVLRWSYNHAGAPAVFSEQTVIDTINGALAKWSAVCGIRFEYAGRTDAMPAYSGSGRSCDGRSVVAWEVLPTWAGANGTCWNGSNELIESDVALDPSDLTTLGKLSMIAAHEFGHGIGLHHTSASTALMRSTVTVDSPQADDIAGCQALYGGPTAEPAPEPESEPEPSASVALDPSSLDFGVVAVDLSATRWVRIKNHGTATLRVHGYSQSGSTDFSRRGCTTSTKIATGGYCSLKVTFKPTASGARSARLSITTSVGTVTLELAGAGQ